MRLLWGKTVTLTTWQLFKGFYLPTIALLVSIAANHFLTPIRPQCRPILIFVPQDECRAPALGTLSGWALSLLTCSGKPSVTVQGSLQSPVCPLCPLWTWQQLLHKQTLQGLISCLIVYIISFPLCELFCTCVWVNSWLWGCLGDD